MYDGVQQGVSTPARLYTGLGGLNAYEGREGEAVR